MKKSALALALGCLWAVPGLAADTPVQLKLSLWIPPQNPLVAAAKEWGASVEKQSGGSITAVVFPSEQMGKAFDHYDMTRDGIVDAAYISPGYQPGRFPIINAPQLPLTIADGRKGTAAVDAWYRKYAGTEMQDIHVCFAFIHDPGSLHSRKKVVAPSDVKGVKVRPAQVTVAELVTTLGGTNVQASAPESRDIIERGVADAITFPWNSLFIFGIDKVVKYHIDAPLYVTSYVWGINKARYEGMSPAQKKVIDDHCTTEWAVKFAGPWADFESSGREKIRNTPGHEVIALSPDQLAAWRKAAEPLQKNWEDSIRKVSGDPDAILKDLKASIDQYKAGF